MSIDDKKFFQSLKFDDKGLIPVITQDAKTNEILMFAYMNLDSLFLSVQAQQMVYFSRSRNKLWHKGETSGHFQKIIELLVDCDSDVLLAKVEQVGDIACHTGHRSCFYQKLIKNENTKNPQFFWEENQPILKTTEEIYK